jgi:hypothetical protein
MAGLRQWRPRRTAVIAWHHGSVNGWWYAAGAMFVISAALYFLAATRLAAANPSARLPFLGFPPNRSRAVKLLQFLACFALCIGLQSVIRVLGWSTSIGTFMLWLALYGGGVALIGLAPFVLHNRRVRRAAPRSAESQRPGY